MSKLVDWQDRGTCVLFGDGAGAAILQANQGGNKSCIIHSKIHSDGAYKDILKTDSGLSSEEKKVGVVRMVGREVFKHAVEKMAHSMVEVVEEAGFSMADIDFIVPHQANIRILRSIANNLQIPDEKLIITLNKHANTSSASIPLALDIVQHKFKRGDLILAAAIGGGLSWGAVLIRW
jgi:3-oxoacyl-[acyl-carrier-protein] synthase-3